MSGRGRARCFTSTSPRLAALSSPRPRGHRRARHDRRREAAPASATSTCTACVDDHSPLRLRRAASRARTRRHRRRGARARAIEHFAELGLDTARGGDERQRLRLPKLQRLPAVLERHGARHILTPPYTPRWNGKVERFIQTLQAGVGLRPLLAQLSRAIAGPAILHPLLQPAKAPQLAGRPAADQPRSQRPWVGQLVSLSWENQLFSGVAAIPSVAPVAVSSEGSRAALGECGRSADMQSVSCATLGARIIRSCRPRAARQIRPTGTTDSSTPRSEQTGRMAA